MERGSESNSSIGTRTLAQTSDQAVLLIDGAYLANVMWTIMGSSYRIDFSLLLKHVSWGLTLIHSEYFDVFKSDLSHLYDWIRSSGIQLNLQGWVRNGHQKGVDQELGHRLIEIHEKCQPSVIILLAGDGDFVPSIWRVKRKGVRVEIIAGKNSISPKLYQLADMTRFLGRKDLELLRYENRA